MMTLSDPIVSALTKVSVFSLAKGLLRTSYETELGPLRRNKLLLYSYRVETWGEEVEAVRAWIRQSTIDIVNSTSKRPTFPSVSFRYGFVRMITKIGKNITIAIWSFQVQNDGIYLST